MKKIILMLFTLLCLFLTSCSSNAPDKTYFKLANNYWPTQSKSAIEGNTNRFIYIDSIDVANFLNTNGIVLQTDAIKYNTAINNLWVSPIYQQINERIIQDFTALLPNYFISNESLGKPYATVKLFIEGFHGSYTGDAIIKGRWIVTKNGQIYNKVLDRKIPLNGNGYDALVKALSAGWLNEEIDFVKQMKF